MPRSQRSETVGMRLTASLPFRKELLGMENLIKLIVDNGLSVVCVAYLMYFQHTTMTKMLETLNSIKERLIVIENTLETDKE